MLNLTVYLDQYRDTFGKRKDDDNESLGNASIISRALSISGSDPRVSERNRLVVLIKKGFNQLDNPESKKDVIKQLISLYHETKSVHVQWLLEDLCGKNLGFFYKLMLEQIDDDKTRNTAFRKYLQFFIECKTHMGEKSDPSKQKVVREEIDKAVFSDVNVKSDDGMEKFNTFFANLLNAFENKLVTATEVERLARYKLAEKYSNKTNFKLIDSSGLKFYHYLKRIYFLNKKEKNSSDELNQLLEDLLFVKTKDRIDKSSWWRVLGYGNEGFCDVYYQHIMKMLSDKKYPKHPFKLFTMNDGILLEELFSRSKDARNKFPVAVISYCKNRIKKIEDKFKDKIKQDKYRLESNALSDLNKRVKEYKNKYFGKNYKKGSIGEFKQIVEIGRAVKQSLSGNRDNVENYRDRVDYQIFEAEKNFSNIDIGSDKKSHESAVKIIKANIIDDSIYSSVERKLNNIKESIKIKCDEESEKNYEIVKNHINELKDDLKNISNEELKKEIENSILEIESSLNEINVNNAVYDIKRDNLNSKVFSLMDRVYKERASQYIKKLKKDLEYILSNDEFKSEIDKSILEVEKKINEKKNSYESKPYRLYYEVFVLMRKVHKEIILQLFNNVKNSSEKIKNEFASLDKLNDVKDSVNGAERFCNENQQGISDLMINHKSGEEFDSKIKEAYDGLCKENNKMNASIKKYIEQINIVSMSFNAVCDFSDNEINPYQNAIDKLKKLSNELESYNNIDYTHPQKWKKIETEYRRILSDIEKIKGALNKIIENDRQNHENVKEEIKALNNGINKLEEELNLPENRKLFELVRMKVVEVDSELKKERLSYDDEFYLKNKQKEALMESLKKIKLEAVQEAENEKERRRSKQENDAKEREAIMQKQKQAATNENDMDANDPISDDETDNTEKVMLVNEDEIEEADNNKLEESFDAQKLKVKELIKDMRERVFNAARGFFRGRSITTKNKKERLEELTKTNEEHKNGKLDVLIDEVFDENKEKDGFIPTGKDVDNNKAYGEILKAIMEKEIEVTPRDKEEWNFCCMGNDEKELDLSTKTTSMAKELRYHRSWWRLQEDWGPLSRSDTASQEAANNFFGNQGIDLKI